MTILFNFLNSHKSSGPGAWHVRYELAHLFTLRATFTCARLIIKNGVLYDELVQVDAHVLLFLPFLGIGEHVVASLFYSIEGSFELINM